MMLKFLKIWSLVFAIFLAAIKTYAEHMKGHPYLDALQTYLFLGWIGGVFVFPRSAPKILLSGWAFVMGWYLMGLIDNVAFWNPLQFVINYFIVMNFLVLATLFLSNYLIKAERQPVANDQKNSLPRMIKTGSMLFGGFLVVAQLFGAWGEDRHWLYLLPYFLIAAWIILGGALYDARPKLLFIALWLAFGFLGSEPITLIEGTEEMILKFKTHTNYSFAIAILALIGAVFVFLDARLRFKGNVETDPGRDHSTTV